MGLKVERATAEQLIEKGMGPLKRILLFVCFLSAFVEVPTQGWIHP
jgi:hypothetical protein